MNKREIIAKNISCLRKREKMTQAQLAEKLHYSDKAISKRERGDSLPDAEMLYEIATFFNVKIEYLFEDHEYEGISNETLKEIHKRQRNFRIILVTFLTIILLSIVGLIVVLLNNQINIPHPIISYILFALGVLSTFLGIVLKFIGYSSFFSPSISLSVWLTAAGLYLFFQEYNVSYIFVFAIIIQILILVCPKIYDIIPTYTIESYKKKHQAKAEAKKEKKNEKKKNNN